jgi:hypothetical protein
MINWRRTYNLLHDLGSQNVTVQQFCAMVTWNFVISELSFTFSLVIYNLHPQSSKTESVKTPLEHILPEFPNIYLRRDIKSVSQLQGQGLYIGGKLE